MLQNTLVKTGRRLPILLLAFETTLMLLPASCQSQTKQQGDAAAPPPISSAPLPSVLPPPRGNCTADNECGLFNGENERVGNPGGPVGCCLTSVIPSVRAANKDWLAQLSLFCASRPPGPCPPGNGPPARPACHAGHCVVACGEEAPCRYYAR